MVYELVYHLIESIKLLKVFEELGECNQPCDAMWHTRNCGIPSTGSVPRTSHSHWKLSSSNPPYNLVNTESIVEERQSKDAEQKC